jgi:uncharacterized protein (TIGR03067 family)
VRRFRDGQADAPALLHRRHAGRPQALAARETEQPPSAGPVGTAPRPDEARQGPESIPAGGPVNDPDPDLERLQGTWATAAMIIDGWTIPEVALTQRRVIIIDDKYVVVDENRTLRRGTFRIDAAATPKRIDTRPADGPNAGQVNPGIYEFVGDLLRLCYAPPGRPRPVDFTSSLGSGQWLVTDRKEVPAMSARVSPVIVVVTDKGPGFTGPHGTRVHHRDLPEMCGRGPTHREAAINLLQHLIGESGAVADGWHRAEVERVIAEVRAFLDEAG